MGADLHLLIDFAVPFIGSLVIFFLKRRDDDLERRDDAQDKRAEANIKEQDRQFEDIEKKITEIHEDNHRDRDRMRIMEINFSKVEVIANNTNYRLDEQRRYFDARFDRIEKILDEMRK